MSHAICVSNICQSILRTRPRKRVAQLYPAINILTTELIVLELIRQGVLDLAAADAFKLDSEQNHRFRLPFGSFAERLGP